MTIRGLRFTYKGGLGSGHHGHAGRPGEIGGSTPTSKAANLFRENKISGLSEEESKNTIAVLNHIPDEHIKNLASIIPGETPPGMAAIANLNREEIIYDSRTAGSRSIAHEVAHFAWDSYPKSKQDEYTTSTMKVLDELKGFNRDQLAQLGLRKYSILDEGELWSDAYSLWARKPLKNYIDSVHIRKFSEAFPEFASVLNREFGIK